MADKSTAKALAVAQIASPILLLSYFLITSLILFFKPVESNNTSTRRAFRKPLELTLTGLIGVLYIAESITVALVEYNVSNEPIPDLIFTLYSTLAWLVLFLESINSGNGPKKYNVCGAWALAFCLELLVLGLSSAFPLLHGPPRVVQRILQTLRLLSVASLIALETWDTKAQNSDEETVPLLEAVVAEDQTFSNATVANRSYGTSQAKDQSQEPAATSSDKDSKTHSNTNLTTSDNDEEDEDEEAEYKNATARVGRNWWQYAKTFKIFLPYMWPTGNLRLQLHFVGLVICILIERALNPLVPIAFGSVIDALSKGKAATESVLPWAQLSFYIVFGLINGTGIPTWKRLLCYTIQRDSELRLKTASYDHLMNLSCDFHNAKKSGATWQLMSRGVSVVRLFKTVAIDLLPMTADLIIAVSVLRIKFDAYMGLIIALTAVLYWWSTMTATATSLELRRSFIKDWEKEYYQMTESSLNWSTVSYFCRHPHEMSRYKDRVSVTQSSSFRMFLFSSVISMVKSFILRAGLFAACILISCQVVGSHRKVGDFVFLISYWGELTGPLEYFASGFTDIAEYLIDAEKLLEMLQKRPSIRDSKGAPDFVLKEGGVRFEDVSFSYDGKRQVSNQVSFNVKPGQTVALVGETGSGKSTIIRLLFRFYDPTRGRILVDGQDIREIALDSYRKHVGVVPQDPVLFNLSIMENLRYGNLEATDDEVQAVCKAVSLHDKVVSFTKGYNEVVGERGAKLSGGELQRVAIARAMLKNPRILLLDEATSSVDTKTEVQIQHSLAQLSKNRTTFVIAHRLSTVINAHKILVIKDGKVAEAGSHVDLLKQNGLYHELWKSQRLVFLGNEPGTSRLRSKSPAKDQAVLVNNLGDSGEGRVLIKQMGAEDESDKKSTRSTRRKSGSPHDHAAHRISHDSESDRGRSPTKGVLHTLRRRRSDSQSPKKASMSKNAPTIPMRAGSGLKPDAPEFVPKSFQRAVLSTPVSPTRSTNDLVKVEKVRRSLESTDERIVPGEIPTEVNSNKDEASHAAPTVRSKSVSALEPISQEKKSRLKSISRSPKRKSVGAISSKTVTIQDGAVQQTEAAPDDVSSTKEPKEKFKIKSLLRRKKSASEPAGQLDGLEDVWGTAANGSPSHKNRTLGHPPAVFEARKTTCAVPRSIAGTIQGYEALQSSEDLTGVQKAQSGHPMGASVGSNDTDITIGPKILAPANTPNTMNSPTTATSPINSPMDGDESKRRYSVGASGIGRDDEDDDMGSVFV